MSKSKGITKEEAAALVEMLLHVPAPQPRYEAAERGIAKLQQIAGLPTVGERESMPSMGTNPATGKATVIEKGRVIGEQG